MIQRMEPDRQFSKLFLWGSIPHITNFAVIDPITPSFQLQHTLNHCTRIKIIGLANKLLHHSPASLVHLHSTICPKPTFLSYASSCHILLHEQASYSTFHASVSVVLPIKSIYSLLYSFCFALILAAFAANCFLRSLSTSRSPCCLSSSRHDCR